MTGSRSPPPPVSRRRRASSGSSPQEQQRRSASCAQDHRHRVDRTARPGLNRPTSLQQWPPYGQRQRRTVRPSRPREHHRRPGALANSIRRFREQGIVLPTFAQLADPTDPARCVLVARCRRPRRADARNLFRVHWRNDPTAASSRRPRIRRAAQGAHRCRRADHRGPRRPFPMIGAHKVLAAYSCLAPRVITGQFDPTRHAPFGRAPVTTPAAGSPSVASWGAGAWRCSPRA